MRYLRTCHSLSLEEQNLEEYLTSNRMLETALFNEQDVSLYRQLGLVKRQLRHRGEEISDTLREKLKAARGSVVIDDAENALMNSPELVAESRDDQSIPTISLKQAQSAEEAQKRESEVKELAREAEKASRSCEQSNPLVQTLFERKKDVLDDEMDEESFVLYDVMDDYSLNEMKHMWKKGEKKKDPTRCTLTLRRQNILKKLFMNTLTDGNEFQYMKHMLVKLVGSTDGEIRLPAFVNTPENLAKIRAYLQSLNMTFEQIDTILGDDSDFRLC